MNSSADISVPCIVDVEASGFGPHSYPIEIGLALDNGDKFCTLLTPAPDWTHWDEAAEKVHRIPRKMLRDYGKDPAQVAQELNRILKGKTVYTDGWVVDNTWIIKLFSECQMEPAFFVSSLEMILNEAQMNAWHETKEEIQKELDLKRHRASNDALVIQKTWVRTRDASGKN